MKIIFIILSAVLSLVSCSTPEQKNINAEGETNQPAATRKIPALSPTETLRALSEASRNKNPQEIRKYLSSGTIALLEEIAEERQRPLDELLKEEGGPPFPKMPETRNEKIDGENATIEVKNDEIGQFFVLPFIREDGVWKVALDLYLDAEERRLTEEMNDPAPKKSKPANRK